MRLLLINPRFAESFWSFRFAVRDIVPGKRTLNPPLGLATLAALCPAHWEVSIVDENVESVPLDPQADIVGVCGMGAQFARQRELLAYYRARGYFVVAGGSYASLCPEQYTTLAHTTIAGEAEYIWPAFCRDFEAGSQQALYRETGTVDLADSPTPRFDLLKLHLYNTASLQFSRGCPYLCEFCDIIVMFGRRPRVKNVEQIGRELDALRAQGARQVFFVDDNLIGNRTQAKALLRFLADYQNRHDYRFGFGTEASLNPWVAQWSRTAMSTTTIRLPPELKARVAAAAERAGTTSHNFILQAIAENTAQDERRADFLAVAERRYAGIVASGKTIPWSEMRRYLEDRVAGKKVRRPAARKLAR
jgi:predicted transcriptional regulator